jgi:hypothetical protein
MKNRYPPIIILGMVPIYLLVFKIFKEPILICNHDSQKIMKKKKKLVKKLLELS